jgi:hypothetical protein
MGVLPERAFEPSHVAPQIGARNEIVAITGKVLALVESARESIAGASEACVATGHQADGGSLPLDNHVGK